MTGQFAPSYTGSSHDSRISLSSVASRSALARRKARPFRRREVNQVLRLFDLFASLRKREEGQTMAEYGVVLAVITLAVIGAITLLSGQVRSAIESVANILP